MIRKIKVDVDRKHVMFRYGIGGDGLAGEG